MKLNINPVAFKIKDDDGKDLGGIRKIDTDCAVVDINICVSTGGMRAVGEQIDLIVENSNKNLVELYKGDKK